MTTTSKLGLSLVLAGNGAEALANTSFQELDALCQGSVKTRTLSAPSSPTTGDCFIVKASGSGAWTGKDWQIAQFINGSWKFYVPKKGWQVYVEDENVVVTFTGTLWKSVTGESILAVRRTSSNFGLGTGSWTPIDWNAETRKDACFTHDNSTNTDQLVLAEAGDYHIAANLTVEGSGSAGLNRVDFKLTLGGSDVTGSLTSLPIHVSNFPRSTVPLDMLFTATAGQILRVEGQRQAGAGTINLVSDSARLVLRRV